MIPIDISNMVDFSSLEDEFRNDVHPSKYIGTTGSILEYRSVIIDGNFVEDMMPPAQLFNQNTIDSTDAHALEPIPLQNVEQTVSGNPIRHQDDEAHPVEAFPETYPGFFFKAQNTLQVEVHQPIPAQTESVSLVSPVSKPMISDDEEDRPIEAFPDSDSSLCDQTSYSNPQADEIPSALTMKIISPVCAAAPPLGAQVYNDDDVLEAFLKEKIAIEKNTAVSFGSTNSTSGDVRFRDYQREKWEQRYKELKQVFQETGRSSVHHTDFSKKGLARWIKRQRAQYKLRREGKASSMTDERVEALNHIQFVWDSHGSAWEDRILELTAFRAKHNHCNVSSVHCPASRALVSWTKCQRRQYRLWKEGKKSSLTEKRISQLESLGFQFHS